jgi:hypothetical protein
MVFPIIEVREKNLFVLTRFNGQFLNEGVKARHNLSGNKVKFIIDSNGTLWELNYENTDNSGLRKLISKIWNVSSDCYSYAVQQDITIGKLREILTPLTRSKNTDFRELAKSLINPISECNDTDRLRDKVELLNL